MKRELLDIINKRIVYKYDFDEIWLRIRHATDLKTLKNLAALVDTSPQNVSNKRKGGKFPAEWGYLVCKEYGLNIEWLMEGIIPLEPDQVDVERKNNFITDIEKWLIDFAANDPDAFIWFELEFKRKFPEFADWFQKRS